jgi:DNA-binding NarL/FixJ family response regulator
VERPRGNAFLAVYLLLTRRKIEIGSPEAESQYLFTKSVIESRNSTRSSARLVVPKISYFHPGLLARVSCILAEDYVRVLKQKGAVDTYDLLRSREREILQLLAEGKTNKEVATALTISPYTVETHRGHILQKLDLHNSAELVLYAVRKGIILLGKES